MEKSDLRIPGITEDSYKKQISILKNDKVLHKLFLEKPCSLNDGIIPIDHFDDFLTDSSFKLDETFCSFIPASGSATRMFDIHSLENHFISNIKKLPFYNEIKMDFEEKKDTIIELINQKDFKNFNEIYLYVLRKYIKKPKAILPFHIIDKFNISPIEEIIYLNCTISRERKMYFTIQSGHMDDINNFLDNSKFLESKKINLKSNIDFSFQSLRTNSICLLDNDEILRDSNGDVYSHPSGHGALIENINNIKEKYFYIHNIDNISPHGFQRRINNIKKMSKIISLIKINFNKIIRGCLENNLILIKSDNFYNNFIKDFFPNIYKEKLTADDLQTLAITLNRPLRVCGFVKDENSKGGKPFWVKDKNNASLQIVEESQVNLDDPREQKIWNQSDFFNPVEMICCNRDFNDKKFNLMNFSDDNLQMIVKKKIFGKDVRFIEKPGLWNGSMHNWNSIFVEIDPDSFTPVKNICDLFLDIHQP